MTDRPVPPELPVRVWHVDPADLPPAAERLLSSDEAARVERMRRPADRARGRTARALTRAVLSELLDLPPAQVRLLRTCAACGADHGKPRLPAGGPDFSLSHSGPAVVLAVAPRGEVGIDVETATPGRPHPDVRGDLVAPGDRHPSPEDHRGWLTLWVRKEAALKATGEGLAVPLGEVLLTSVAGSSSAVWHGRRATGPERMWLADLDLGVDLVGAVALRDGTPSPQLEDGAAAIRHALFTIRSQWL